MTASRTLPALFNRETRHIHCVGIAGMGLGPLAIYLSRLGYTVTGEDDSMTDAMRAHLDRANIAILPLASDNPQSAIRNPQLLAISTAIPATHPAILAAKHHRIPIVRRGELLAEILRDKKLVAICGSHGKTTTTAMLVTALRRANFSAGYILGALFADPAIPPADTGATDYVVAEIDESDGTIENFTPEITLATNLDWDHPDHYRTPADIARAFHSLFARTNRAVLLPSSTGFQPVKVEAGVPTAFPSSTGFQPVGSSSMGFQPMPTAHRAAGSSDTGDSPVLAPTPNTFGTAANATYRYTITHPTSLPLASDNPQSAIRNPQSTSLILEGCYPIASATLRALGAFNAANAAAALAAAHLMGAPLAPDLLADYPGVLRRQTILHATDTLTVIEDYAHHPAEIHALLTTLRSTLTPTTLSSPPDPSDPSNRSAPSDPPAIPQSAIRNPQLHVVFQPHRYTRTAQFLPEFASALSQADRLYLLDVYPAGEPPIPGGHTSDLHAALNAAFPHLPVTYNHAATPSPLARLSIQNPKSKIENSATLAALTRDLRPRDLVAFIGAGDIDRHAREWLATHTATTAPNHNPPQ